MFLSRIDFSTLPFSLYNQWKKMSLGEDKRKIAINIKLHEKNIKYPEEVQCKISGT